MTLPALQAQAKDAATKLGHKLAGWSPNPDYPSVSFALCRYCSLAVRVDIRPRVPSLAVSGDAGWRPCPVLVKRLLRKFVPPAPEYRYVNRAQVFDRDRGVCARCKLDTLAMFETLSTSTGAEYRRLYDFFLDEGWPASRLQGLDLWDANHIIPVAEFGGELGLGNIETLCIPCHAKETKALAGRLAKRRDYETRLAGELMTSIRLR